MDGDLNRDHRIIHNADRLAKLLNRMSDAGVSIRHDWLDGSGGGLCEVAGQPTFFIDLAQSVEDQLEVVTDAVAELRRAA